MTWSYSSAPNGNIALTSELDLLAGDGESVTAIAFGRTPEEAGQQARNALLKDFDRVQQAFIEGWAESCSKTLKLGMTHESVLYHYRDCITERMTHEETSYP